MTAPESLQKTAKMSEAFFAALLAASAGDCKTACKILKQLAKDIVKKYHVEETSGKK